MDPWVSSIAALVALLLTTIVTLHVLWSRSDSRTSLAWIGFAWLLPFLGALLYAMFGVNRIHRKANRLRAVRHPLRRPYETLASEEVVRLLPSAPQMHQLVTALDTVTARPLVLGNRITALHSGDEAYPAMIAAIDGAQHSIAMQSYIFEARGPGQDFLAALVRAHERGVQVRVLVDAAGERYGYPRVTNILRRGGVRCARFLPAFPPWRWPYLNLRNHRKVLVIDDRCAFTGGLNIRPDHVLADNPEHPTKDIHFMIEGPVAHQLLQIFAEDWYFAAHEHIDGPPFFTPEGGRAPGPGQVPARAVADGPDEDYDKVRWGFLSALACAQERIVITTPYFLPDDALIMALGVAARRGVAVDVIVPEKGNLRVVDWAMDHLLQHVDLSGVHIWRSPPPFDHSKLIVVDGAWVFLGSSNWDARSLKLNFEVNVECYDRTLGGQMEAMLRGRIEASSRNSQRQSRPLARLRNALAALFTPYL